MIFNWCKNKTRNKEGCHCPYHPNPHKILSVVDTTHMSVLPTAKVPEEMLDSVPTNVIVRDLNSLDAALAIMLRSLEIRDVRVFGLSFKSLTYPAIFLQDLTVLAEKYNGLNWDAHGTAARLEDILQEFTQIQPGKQRYAGLSINIPFAGTYKCENTHKTLCGDIVVSSYTDHAIKDTDLSLRLVDLMDMCRLFSEHLVQIHHKIDMWSIAELDRAARQKQQRECMLTAQIAPSFGLTYGQTNTAQHQIDESQRIHCLKRQAQLDATHAKRLEYDRMRKENLRKTMTHLSGCSPTMQSALRPGTREIAALSPSVGEVRLQWERELDKRATLETPHPADVGRFNSP